MMIIMKYMLYFKINKMVFKTANVFDLIDHHQV